MPHKSQGHDTAGGHGFAEPFKNVKSAFIIKDRSVIRDRDILLVDDVFTTGATERECSRMLKKAGARNVYVRTLAHGVMDSASHS